MTALSLTKTPLSQIQTDAIVVGVTSGTGGLTLVAGAEDVEKAFKKRLGATLASLGATGKAGEVTKLGTLGATTAPTLVAVGLGPIVPRGRVDPEVVRRGIGAAMRALDGTARVATSLAGVNGDGDTATLRGVAEGALLGAYSYNRYRHASKQLSPPSAVSIVVANPRDKAMKTALQRAIVVGEAVALCRDLVNTPPADLHPADFAQAAIDACRAVGCDVEVLDEKALKKGGYGGILGVGSGSANPPRLVRISHTSGRKAKKSIHLVGKGITFDSGGLSLKQPAGMETMKCDMSGAAAVIATLQAVAKLHLDVNVVGWVPTAENMPSGTAIRPSDVLTMRGGRTVEVNNTDAEGRLILADAIARAGEDGADVIIDVATLTGAQVVALGNHVFAVMSNDDALRDQVVSAATAAGEQAWPMPLPPELRKSLDSEIADIMNTGERAGGMLTAGVFLKEFVPDGTPWAHLDIAGPAFNTTEPHGYTSKGGTGVAVRTLVEFLENAV